MTNRTQHVTFGVVLSIICVITLLFLLHKTHDQLQELRERLLETDEKYLSISKQFDSLFEYKERLEKAFLNLKQNKATMISEESLVKMELSELKSSYVKQIRSIQEELDGCRRREEVRILGPSFVSSHLNQGPVNSVPLTSPQIMNRPSQSSKDMNREDFRSFHQPTTKVSLVFMKEKDAIQSPIGHVPAQAAIPSGDPNSDLAGNVII